MPNDRLPMALTRCAGALICAFAIAACSTDDSVGSGLLDPGGGSGGTVDPDNVNLRILGPGSAGSGGVAVVSACTESGFIAELTDGGGDGIPKVFVRVRPDLGSVKASNGSSNGGATTDAQGRARFDYIAPANVTRNDIDVLVASVTIDDVVVNSDDFEVEVVPGPPPELSIIGPAASGALKVPAGTTRTGFIAEVTPGESCQPREGHTVSFQTNLGEINAPPDDFASFSGTTDRFGEVEFSYTAPDTVSASTRVMIRAEASVSRQTDTATYALSVEPPTLSFTGPNDAAPGRVRTGFQLQLTRSDGIALQGEKISVTSSVQGTISDTNPNPSAERFVTDAFGRINFSFKPPVSITTETVATLTATVTGTPLTRSFDLTIKPDTFLFTAPDAGTPIPVGVNNRQPLNFSWRTATSDGGAPVQGTLKLTTDSPTALFVVNDDPQNPVDSVVVNTNSSGTFAFPVAIYSNSSEFVTITARDQAATQRQTTLTVQFVDQPGTTPGHVNLVVDPLQVETSTTTQNKATIEFTVLNEAFEPIAGQDVSFTLVQSASGDNLERIFPGGGTTDGQGQARSEYFSGRSAGTARIRACVVSVGRCQERDVEVVTPAP